MFIIDEKNQKISDFININKKTSLIVDELISDSPNQKKENFCDLLKSV